ncbi:MAG: hypothetical protein DRI87_01990 [Bacteroidetes bacterium]|nr:MAG: hypothetical protein DRI87_01990 [Bacteroidota bacterium]
MSNLPVKLRRYLKWTKNYFYNNILYTYYRFKHGHKKKSKGKILWIDFRTNFIRRNIALIVFWFAKAGYTVYYRKTFRSLGSFEFYDRLSFTLPQFKLKRKKPEKVDLILTNRKKAAYAKNEVFVDNNYWQPEKPDTWHVPEGMHPHIYYFNKIPDNLNVTRQNGHRRVKIFFTGNLDENLYDWPDIKDKFNLLSRIKIINLLKSKLNPENLFLPSSRKDLELDFQNKIVLNDGRKVMLDQDNYLNFLTNCSFYLFTPGVGFPLCHNNFESMAAGCIPITQYAHYHFPNLEHGKTCLVFKDEADLIKQVNYALQMDEGEIKKMRENVIRYYDQYLSEEAIVKNIEQKVLLENISKLIILEG